MLCAWRGTGSRRPKGRHCHSRSPPRAVIAWQCHPNPTPPPLQHHPRVSALPVRETTQTLLLHNHSRDLERQLFLRYTKCVFFNKPSCGFYSEFSRVFKANAIHFPHVFWTFVVGFCYSL